jgi:hypothetical protein
MTKGQIAITIGRVRLLDPGKGTQQELGHTFGVSQQTLSQAETIIRHAPELADGVLAKTKTFDAAHSKARERKADAATNRGDAEGLRQAELTKNFSGGTRTKVQTRKDAAKGSVSRTARRRGYSGAPSPRGQFRRLVF